MIERDPYVTIEQAIELTGFDRATIYRKIDDGLFAVKASDEKAANGRHVKLFRLLSLPDAAQLTYWQRELQPPAADSASPNLAEYPERARHEALRRLPIVLDALAIMESRDAVSTRLKALAAQHGEGRSTLYGWVDKYREAGFAGLLPGWGKKAGQFYAISDALKSVIEDEYLRPSCPSITTVHRNVEKFCEKARIPAPCVATINRYLATIPQAVVLERRHGEQAYRAQAEPKIHRDYLDLAVGEMWVGDHRVLDLFVTDGGKTFRPWLTAWMDLRSRTVVGWHLDWVPNAHTIALALRAGILRFGLPKRLYMDNGKDYTCTYWGGKTKYSRDVTLNADSRAVLALLNITVTHAQVRSPWSKAIEPWFGHTLPAWERTLPGWCGRDNKERPEKLNAEVKNGLIMSLDECRQRVAECIEAYHDREHHGEGMDGATPRSLWQGVEKRIPDAAALDCILMKHKPVKVYRDGIHLFGFKYWHDALIPHFDQKVEIRYDAGNIGALRVFKNNALLCEAKADKAFSMGLSEQEQQEIGRRRKKSRQILRDYAQHRAIAVDPDQAARLVVNQRPAGKVYALKPKIAPEPGGTVNRPITGFERSAPPRAEAISALPAPGVDTSAAERDAIHKELMES
jgi:putative transposase